MTLIQLGQHRDLFRDEASYRSFVRIFQDALSGGNMPMVLSEEEGVLFTAISPESTKEALCKKIVDRIGENPLLLDEIRSRLEDDRDLVD